MKPQAQIELLERKRIYFICCALAEAVEQNLEEPKWH